MSLMWKCGSVVRGFKVVFRLYEMLGNEGF